MEEFVVDNTNLEEMPPKFLFKLQEVEPSLSVFSIYGGTVNNDTGALLKGGLFLGGLDTGMDLTQ